MFITDDKSGIFKIEKIDDKYCVADNTIVTQTLEEKDDNHILLYVMYGYNHPKTFKDIYIVGTLCCIMAR